MKNERNLKSGNSLKKLKKNALNSTDRTKKRISAEKSRKYWKIASIATSALAILALVCIVTISLLNDAGVIIRGRSLKKSDDLSINGAMLTYLFWDNYTKSMSGEYANYYSLQGITSPEDLYKDNPHEEGTTWWDHFFDVTAQTVEAMLNYAQYALDNDRGLSDKDISLIDEEIGKIEDTAYIYGYKPDEYIAETYGRGVNMSDVRDVLELICLSNNGMLLAQEKLAATEAEIDEYYKTDTNSLKKADYYFFVLGISGKDNLTAEQDKYYSEKAEYISRSSSEEEFKSKVREYLTEQNDKLSDSDSSKLGKDELEAAIKTELSAMEYTADVYSDSVDVDKWIFSDERIAGETYINHQDGYGTYGIAYIRKPVYIDPEWRDIAKTNIVKEKTLALLDELKEDYPLDITKLKKAVADLA